MNDGWADKVQLFLLDKRLERRRSAPGNGYSAAGALEWDRGARLRTQTQLLVRVLCLLVGTDSVAYFIEAKLTGSSGWGK